MRQDVVKDNHFEEISEARVDSKNRITLGRKNSSKARIYKVYKNLLGQLVLDPQVTIPAHEQWLFKNKKARDMVLRGLDDARNKRFSDRNEDFSKYLDQD